MGSKKKSKNQSTASTGPDDTMEFAANEGGPSRGRIRTVLAAGAVASAIAGTATYRRHCAMRREQQQKGQSTPSPSNFGAAQPA